MTIYTIPIIVQFVRKEHPEVGRMTTKRYNEKYPLKCQATRYVSKAIRTKEIPPAKELLCKDCSGLAQEYHHHLGYEREHWKDVVALCRKCHRIAHKEMVVA